MHFIFYLTILLLVWGISIIEAQNELVLNKFCPVMEEEPGDPKHELEHAGKKVRLCCKKCVKLFQKNPQKWIERKDPSGKPYLPQFYNSQESPLSVPPQKETKTEPLLNATPPPSSPTRSALNRFLDSLGKFHLVLVHFPIALIFCAFLLEMSQLFQKKKNLAESSKTLLLLSVLFTLFTVPTGWCMAMSEAVPEKLSSYVEWHRWLGVTTFIVLITLVTWIELQKNDSDSKQVVGIRILLMILTGLVLWTAHYGGAITFGPDFFPWSF